MWIRQGRNRLQGRQCNTSMAECRGVAGRSTLSVSVYRPNPTVDEAIGFNINTSSPQ